MKAKLFDSELKIMEVLWREGDTTAKRIAELVKESTGWSKTTTYTVIKKCIDKKAVQRSEPNFLCHALLSQKEVQEYETEELIDKLYDGAPDRLVAALLENKRFKPKDIKQLKQLVNSME